MHKRKFALFIIVIALVTIILMVLYNRTYHINLDKSSVNEIQVKTLSPYKVTTITNKDDITKFLENVSTMEFTHPTFNTGKGWTSDVIIKIKGKNNSERQYHYWISNDNIHIGSFQYKIISGGADVK